MRLHLLADLLRLLCCLGLHRDTLEAYEDFEKSLEQRSSQRPGALLGPSPTTSPSSLRPPTKPLPPGSRGKGAPQAAAGSTGTAAPTGGALGGDAVGAGDGSSSHSPVKTQPGTGMVLGAVGSSSQAAAGSSSSGTGGDGGAGELEELMALLEDMEGTSEKTGSGQAGSRTSRQRSGGAAGGQLGTQGAHQEADEQQQQGGIGSVSEGEQLAVLERMLLGKDWQERELAGLVVGGAGGARQTG